MDSLDNDSSQDVAGGPRSGKRLRRRHLNEQQQIVLEREYQKNPRFDSDRVVVLAKQLGLNRTKVYKWGWDRRKKEQDGRISNVNASQQGMFHTERVSMSTTNLEKSNEEEDGEDNKAKKRDEKAE